MIGQRPGDHEEAHCPRPENADERQGVSARSLTAAAAAGRRSTQGNHDRFFPSVSPLADTNLITGTLLQAGQASEIQLSAPGRIQFRISFPTHAVVETLPVRLTVVTNVLGVRATRGFLTAVKLEPEVRMLSAPVFLEIEFPKAIPAREISSYAFDNDGRRLHLVPDLVSTNRVRILVNSLRGYGCGAFTLKELQALAATVPPPKTTVMVRPKATLEECYPDEVEEAQQLHEELTNKLRPLQQEAARQLGEARQQQLLGVEEPGNPAYVTVFAAAETFADQEFKPRVPNAVIKCAVAREL